jgi:DNA (cytosine-5)-methyltransferase 1
VQLSLLRPDLAVGDAIRLIRPELDSYGGDRRFLSSCTAAESSTRDAVTVVDLFAGGGGLSLGVQLAALQRERAFHVTAAVELDPLAASVYRTNFVTGCFEADVRELFGKYGAPLSLRERLLRSAGVDFVLGGPPCQGNSDLNNYTRRNDERNQLYFSVARAVEVLKPRHVIIENVPGVRHDSKGVVTQTASALRDLGYYVTGILLDAVDFGVAQNRKRYFLIASHLDLRHLSDLISAHRLPHRPLHWAIDDLVGRADPASLVDSPGETKGDNLERIRYLFAHDVFDLPDAMRPPCHSEKQHSYKSVYGRLQWEKPAQTITRGFYSVCMGRYIHPSEPRSLTAHEAARIQFLPDFFDLTPARTRTALAKLIGNVVPPKLGYVLAQSLLCNELLSANS